MTTRRLLPSFRQHIRFLALLFSFSLVIPACKSKQKAAANSQKPSEASKQVGSNTEIKLSYLFVNACAERMKGNLQEAREILEECKKLDPQNAAVHYELGMVYRMLGAYDLAINFARFSAAADPLNEWYQLLLIDCYNRTRQYQPAIKVRENLVKNFPGRNDFKEDLAIEYSVVGQYEKAFRIYSELEKTFGVSEQITLNKVKLLKSLKKEKEAETELLKLSVASPNETRYYDYLAEYYLEQKQSDKALSMYNKILEIDPNNAQVNLALHDYHSARGENEKAYDYLKKAFSSPDLDVQVKSNILSELYKRAQSGSSSDKLHGAELAGIMLTVNPTSPQSAAIYADFLAMDNKIAEAAKYYYQASLYEKKNYRVWESLMSADNYTNQYDSLEHHSRQAMELFPNQPVSYLYNGVANTQLKNYKAAVQSLKDGKEFVIDNRPLLLDFYRALGDAAYYNKDYELSDKAFEDALKIDSDNAYVLNNYAYFLSLRGDQLEKAEKLARRCNELKPGIANYMDTYGWIFFLQKNYRNAEGFLSKASKQAPLNPTILEHYGDVLFRLDKIDEAVKYWEEALKAGGPKETLSRKIKEKKLND